MYYMYYMHSTYIIYIIIYIYYKYVRTNTRTYYMYYIHIIYLVCILYIYTSVQAQGETQVKALPQIKRGKFWGNACRNTIVDCSACCVSICTFVLVKPANHKLGALENLENLLGKFVRCSSCRMRTHSTCSVRKNIVYHRTSTVIICDPMYWRHRHMQKSERASEQESERESKSIRQHASGVQGLS